MCAPRSLAKTCSFSAAVLCAALSSSTAQQPAAAECTSSAVAAMTASDLGPAWSAFAPDTLKVRFRPAREAGAWTEIADTLAMLFGLAPRPAGLVGPPASLAALPPAERTMLAAEFDSLRAELAAGQRDSTARLNGRITSKRFAVEVRPFPPPAVRLFASAANPGLNVQPLPPAETRSVCWLAIASTDLATFFGGAARASLAAALHRRAGRWDNFFRGYSMTPIELFVNGYVPRPSLEPPPLQIVLAHLSAGQEMYKGGPLSTNSIRRKTVLVVEPIGFIRYFDNFAGYWGATWAVAYPDSGGLATGPMLHFKNLGHVAYLWRARDAAGRRTNAAMISLDLYRFVAGIPERFKQAKDAAIADCLADAPACVKHP